ncbi:MAG TPA: sigma-70 family RNA polymerase sigma factor [Armatimonadota bacterium]|nr:sigma-70 family RNA polymerase sigma factor [Armatimonadota bacterium]
MQYDWFDAALAEGLCQGNDAAAQQLIDTYSLPLYRYLRRRCACEEDALDILSMVFQKAVAASRTYDSARGSFKNWLYRIAQTARADFYRAWGITANAELPAYDILTAGEGEDLFSSPAQDPAVAEPEAEDSPLTRAVQEVFDRMPKRYVEVLQLAHTDLTREEIAAQLGVTRDHLRVLLNRANARFKALAQQQPVLAAWLAHAESLPEAEDADESGQTALVAAWRRE